jgi:hypothetical protein
MAGGIPLASHEVRWFFEGSAEDHLGTGGHATAAFGAYLPLVRGGGGSGVPYAIVVLKGEATRTGRRSRGVARVGELLRAIIHRTFIPDVGFYPLQIVNQEAKPCS